MTYDKETTLMLLGCLTKEQCLLLTRSRCYELLAERSLCARNSQGR